MTNREKIEQKLEEMITPLLEEQHFELVDCEYVKEGADWYLRAYIDKEGGITIDDCELISRAMNDRLDEEDFIPEAYIFEVSSPGLTRALKKDRDFARNIDKRVTFRLFREVSGVREGEGVLLAFGKDTVTLLTDSAEFTTERSNLAKINQAFVWDNEEE